MKAEQFFEKVGSAVILRSRLISVLMLVLTIFLGWRIKYLVFDNSDEVWFNRNNPALERLTEFKDTFGNEDYIYLVMSGINFFEPLNIELLRELEEEFKDKVPYVKTVKWFGNAEYLEGDEGSLYITEFSEFYGRGIDTPEKLLARLLQEKPYVDFLYTGDGSVIGFLADFAAYPEEVSDPPSLVWAAVKTVIENPRYRSLGIRAVGPPILHTVYNELSYSEALKYLILGLLIMVVILYAIGRSVKDALVPLLIIVTSIIWALGLTELLGYKLNIFIILLPVLLCCACVGDSMHIIELYRQILSDNIPRLTALRLALGRSGLPCFITTTTTVAGFLSFQTSDIPPCREMGVYAAVGVVVAYILSIILVPIFYGQGREVSDSQKEMTGNKPLLPVQSEPSPRASDIYGRFLLFIYRINISGRKIILAVSALVFALALYGYLQVETESNTVDMLSPRLPLRQAYDFVDEHIGGAMSVEFILDSFEPDGLKDPAFLNKVADLQAYLDQRPEVTKTVSVNDVIKEISQALHSNDPVWAVLPESRESAAQYILLYEMANGRELDRLVSFDSQKARLTARTKSLNTRDVRRLSEEVDSASKAIFGRPEAVTLTGGLDWTRSMNDQMAVGQRQTFLAAFITLTAIMSLSMKSLRLGLLSLIPNVIPVMGAIGLAGSLGVYIDMPLMCFSPIIIGLIIDDTTHFLYRFKELFLETGSYEISLEKTLVTVGRPLLFTTLTVVGAFVFLVFSYLSGVSKFGAMGVFAFILALVADFLLMPAILLTFKPFGPSRIGPQESGL
jgi:predicted RND superfamily exporter protein